MALIDLSSLIQPIAGESPTGPDLDLEGDPDYMNFVARIEGQFPDSYFRFDRAQFVFEREYETVSGLLGRSRDLRLLSILARLQILNRDVDGFKASVAAVAALLRERWDDVHPRGESGDFLFRGVALQALEDAPTVLLPLAHVPLLPNRRAGQIFYRTIQVALGKVAPRLDPEGQPIEDVLEPGVIEKAFLDAGPDEIRGRKVLFDEIQASAKAIASITRDKAADNWVPLDKLLALTGEIIAYLDAIIAKLEPSSAAPDGDEAADEDGEQGGGASAAPRLRGRVTTQVQVAAALAAVEDYLVASEPSNPSLLLVRQARDLVGKSFIDVLRVLEPNFAEQATFVIGTTDRLVIPLERLSGFGASPEVAYGAAEPFEDTSEETWSSEDEAVPEAEDEPADVDAVDEASGEAVEPAPDVQAPPLEVARPPRVEMQFKALSRQEALGLLAEVEAFYRQAEPSSPIPVLLTRVRELSNKDFMSILRDMLPANLLRAESGE